MTFKDDHKNVPMSVNSCIGGVNDALKPGISEFVFPPKIFGTTKKAMGEV